MLESVRAWAKTIFHRTRRESHTSTPRPQPHSIFQSNVKSTVNLAASFMGSPSSPSLQRSPDDRSRPSSRFNVPHNTESSYAVTQLTACDPHLIPAVSVSNVLQTSNNPSEPPRRTPGNRRLPSWFPLSSTISMTSRTTHETYSADPSSFFTSHLQSAVLTPATTVVVTPSPAQKNGQLLEIPGTIVSSHGPTAFLPPCSIVTADDRLETGAAVIDNLGEPLATDTGERQFWIRITALGNQPHLLSTMEAGASLVPLISVQPPTGTSDLNQEQPIIPRGAVLNTYFVDSPKGSVSSVPDRVVSDLGGSVHTHDNDFVPSDVNIADDTVPNMRVVDLQSSDAQHQFDEDTLPTISMQNKQTCTTAPPPTIVQYPSSHPLPSASIGPGQFASQLSYTEVSQLASSRQPSLTTLGPIYSTINYPAQLGDRMMRDQEDQAVSPAVLRESNILLENQSDRNSTSQSTPLDAYPLLQRPQNVLTPSPPPLLLPARHDMAPRVNLVAATSLYRGLDSFVGPNARLVSDWLAPAESISHYPSGYPRYSIESLGDLETFGHLELIPAPDSFLSSDEQTWWYSHDEYISPQHLQVHFTARDAEPADDDPGRWLTLGLIGTDVAHGAALYLVQNRKDQYEAMLKVIHPSYLSESQIKKLSRELGILSYLRRRPKTSYIMACMSDSQPFWRSRWDFIHIETPYAAGGNLAQYMGSVDEVQLRLIVNDLASGILYLHEHDIVHCNITTSNITISRAGTCMIANFEDAMFLRWRSGDHLRRPREEISFSQYTAPERRLADPEGLVYFDHAADIWALGIVIYELRNGWIHFDGTGVLPWILSEQMARSSAAESLTNLLFKELLVMDPDQRANAGGLRYSRYFKDGENIQKAFPTPDVAPLIPVPSCSIDWAEPPPSLGYNTCPVWASIKRLTVLDDSFRPGHEFVPEITDNVLNA